MPNSSTGSSGVINFPPIPATNQFQRNGSEAVYKVSETKSACVVVRLDMPGCPDSDLVYWIEGINVHYDHDGRRYGGTMVFNPET
ncbi:unnamed protein product [Microthlaspi erraticum]|uniref:Uncharacterized protein n=1 Tax=Microthlaspi erraticum TaxID=1685480 RepID=A0A6D2JV37_9BRAS|nr:unnamed protein product [Microthlaspi erraticum]